MGLLDILNGMQNGSVANLHRLLLAAAACPRSPWLCWGYWPIRQ
jgi:hypothetical protein